MLPIELENRLDEIRSLIAGFGAELVDISLRKSAPKSVVTLLVDKPGGVTIEDCVSINNGLSAFFDELIEGPYYLEVNSPGLDRPLKTARDFARAIGQWIRIVTSDDRGIARAAVARLESVEGELLRLRAPNGGTVELPITKVIKATREIKI